MLKNKNGVTMVALVITVMIMLIIVSISFATGKELLDSSKAKEYITIMTMVKGEIENINETYEFDGNITHFVGEWLPTTNMHYWYYYYDNMKNLEEIYEKEGIEERKNEVYDNNWYKLDKYDVKRLGIKTKMLDNGESFIVNYTYGVVIYSKGYKKGNKTIYSLDGLLNLDK